MIQKQFEEDRGLCVEKRRLLKKIAAYGEDILKSSRFRSTKYNIQHGSMSVYEHSICVADCSLKMGEGLKRLGFHIREKELVRGALLHDYFLYDWHKHRHPKGIRNLHGFRHPEIAFVNASGEYRLTLCEQEIIRKHMWPLTIVPPTCREAWIVTAADKYCSLLETLRLRNGHGRTVRWLQEEVSGKGGAEKTERNA